MVVLFLAIFGGAILSLLVRRRNPGVGAISGALVLILIVLGFGYTAFATLASHTDEGDPSSSLRDLGRTLTVLLATVGFAGRVGIFQGQRLGMSRGVAWLGGVGQMIPLALVMSLTYPATLLGHTESPGFPVSENVWISLCLACIVAEFGAPLVVTRIPKAKGYRRTFEVPPTP